MALDNREALPAHKLPLELWRPIISSLTVHADRRTLCSVALTSKLLGYEAQHVLFRTTADSFWKRNSLRRHIMFLTAIVGAPKRLGPLVRVYTQIDIAIDPSGSPVSASAENSEAIHLWHLTMSGLSVMINLKRLQFSARNTPSESSLNVLTQCAFKLDSLSWIPPRHLMDNDIQRMLERQERLLHLDLSYFTGPIPTAFCPNLISIRATHRVWADLCLEDDRCIRALDVVSHITSHSNVILIIAEKVIDEDMKTSLVPYAHKIRILSYPSYAKLCTEFVGMPLRNLVLLRLLTYTITNLLYISGYDSMRVLVLHTFDRESFSEGVVSGHLPTIFHENANIRYIDIQTEHTDVFQRYYRPTLDAINQTPTVKLFRGSQMNGLWWECHLDEAEYLIQDAERGSRDTDESDLISNMLSLSL